MSKRKPLTPIETEQVNLRVPIAMLTRLDRLRERLPIRLTKTQCFLDAIAEWIDRKEDALSKR